MINAIEYWSERPLEFLGEVLFAIAVFIIPLSMLFLPLILE